MTGRSAIASPSLDALRNATAPAQARSGLIVTRTPLRISFAGGGTDLAEFYQHETGAVLSTAIDRYVYVTIKRHNTLFGAPIRLNYSETEEAHSIGEIRNEIARECFRLLNIQPPIYMSTVADIPAASGLGSSSAFAVGLLSALHAYRGEHVSHGQLAEEAAHVEIDVLRRPIGKQDHYAAAFGGFNCFGFLASGSVSVESQHFTGDRREVLFRHLLLFWTGITRDATRVLAEQRLNTPERMSELRLLRDHALELHVLFSGRFNPQAVGRALDACWRLKQKLASTISNERIDGWYRCAIDAGAWGGKLCGAGGGGFFLFVAAPELHNAIREALPDLREVSIGYEPLGSRVLMPHVE